jgi:ATP-dependent DNA helicase RecG
MKVTKSVTKFIELIDFLPEARSRSEILNFLEIGNQTKNFTINIKPLIENGIIELTIPDKPKCRFHQYRLTEKGKKLLKQ